MGRLSTHVLDTARGMPASGVTITVTRFDGDQTRHIVAQATTNADGRTDAPLLSGDALCEGVYELLFDAGDYLRASGQLGPGPSFLDQIPIRFTVSETRQHYHVPLLLSPYAYSTYRGS